MVKTRLQASASKYSSPIDCFRKIIANEGGPRALYRGLSANLIGVAPEKSIKLVRNNLAKHTFINIIITYRSRLLMSISESNLRETTVLSLYITKLWPGPELELAKYVDNN